MKPPRGLHKIEDDGRLYCPNFVPFVGPEPLDGGTKMLIRVTLMSGAAHDFPDGDNFDIVERRLDINSGLNRIAAFAENTWLSVEQIP